LNEEIMDKLRKTLIIRFQDFQLTSTDEKDGPKPEGEPDFEMKSLQAGVATHIVSAFDPSIAGKLTATVVQISMLTS
jgi:hypothetical protein